MRTHVMSPDMQGRIDGTVAANLLSGFPDQSSSRHDCDVILVPFSFMSDFKFNPLLKDISKPWVALDFLEYEWNCDMMSTHFVGLNTRDCRWLRPEWWEFDDFAKAHPPIAYFKRELRALDAGVDVYPIEWPCYVPPTIEILENDFNSRRIEVFNSWGFSHPSRPRLHADIFRSMTTHGIGVISEHDQYEGYFKGPCHRTWATIFSPWYARRPITDILWYQERSKISVSLPGCGNKCFRHAEAPVGAIMAATQDDLAWSFPWIHERNCIRLRRGHEFTDLEAATRREDLYAIFLRGLENIDRYRTKRYVNEYLVKTIASHLK